MGRVDRLGVIEIGSRGIRLLVVERRPPPEWMVVLASRGELGLLGAGLGSEPEPMIRPEHLARGAELVRTFVEHVQRYSPSKILLVGTAVFRQARNAHELVQSLPTECPLKVMSPEEEAAASFIAAGWGFREGLLPGQTIVLLDLGGGSLEIVVGRHQRLPQPIAGVTIAGLGALTLQTAWEQAAKHDPASSSPAPSLQNWIQQEIETARPQLDALKKLWPPADSHSLLVAGLGSAVTDAVWLLHGNELRDFRSDRVHGMRVGLPQLKELGGKWDREGALVAPANREEKPPESPGGRPDRRAAARQTRLGLEAVCSVLDYLGLPNLTACGTGLRFGIALAELYDLSLNLVAPTELPPAEAPQPSVDPS